MLYLLSGRSRDHNVLFSPATAQVLSWTHKGAPGQMHIIHQMCHREKVLNYWELEEHGLQVWDFSFIYGLTFSRLLFPFSQGFLSVTGRNQYINHEGPLCFKVGRLHDYKYSCPNAQMSIFTKLHIMQHLLSSY